MFFTVCIRPISHGWTKSLLKRTTFEAVYCLEVSHLSAQSSKWAADPWQLTLKGFISVLRGSRSTMSPEMEAPLLKNHWLVGSVLPDRQELQLNRELSAVVTSTHRSCCSCVRVLCLVCCGL